MKISSINKLILPTTLTILTLSLTSFAKAEEATPVPTPVITPCDDNDPSCGSGGGGGATPTPCPFLTVTPVITPDVTRPGSAGLIKESDVFALKDPCGGGGNETPTPLATSTPTECPTLSIDKNGQVLNFFDVSVECGGGGGGTATPTPTNDTGNGTATPTPTKGSGDGTPTPTPTNDTGNGTATPTPTNDTGNGTATPTPTSDTGNGTATPTPTSNGGGGNGTPTPTPTTGGFNGGGTTDVFVPKGCTVEVPYYKLKALDTTNNNYNGRRGLKRIQMAQSHRIKLTSSKAQQASLKNEFAKRNAQLKDTISVARSGIITVPGVMVQCSQPPASCIKVEHPGIDVFEQQIKYIEKQMQANFKHALKGVEKKSATLMLMRKEGAVQKFPRIAARTKDAMVHLSSQISRSSYICQRP